MIKIYIPNNNKEERLYSVGTIFETFLGLDIDIKYVSRSDYLLEIGNCKVVVEDVFWNKYIKDGSYLTEIAIPQRIFNDDFDGRLFPRIWGSGTYNCDNDIFYIGNDIFAEVFFFLSQWEEYVLRRKLSLTIEEKLNEGELFVIRHELEKRCVVNEVLEVFKYILKKCGICDFREWHFRAMLTHDVDRCFLSSERVLCENVYKMLMDGQVDRATRIMGEYLSYEYGVNPFDSFDALMDMAELGGLKAHFYFKPCVDGDRGFTYSIDDYRVVKAIKNIISRGHYVGAHFSENVLYSYSKMRDEYNRLSKYVDLKIDGGTRMHGLFYDENIFVNLSLLGFVYDTSVGLQKKTGFRTSVCYPYKVYDLKNRKTLNIEQQPFACMDSVSIRLNQNPDDFFEDIKNVIDEVYKYGGVFVSNWHSNLWNVQARLDFKFVYRAMVDYIKDLQNVEDRI